MNCTEMFEIAHKRDCLVNCFDHIICVQYCPRVPQDQLGHLEKMAEVAIQVQLVLLAHVVTEVKVALQ